MGHKDIRYLRTEQKLIDVMLELLTYQNFDQITINSICAAASISRTAFYRHFEDKYLLAVRCVYEILVVIPKEAGITQEGTQLIAMLEAGRKHRKALQNLRRLGCSQELQYKIDSLFYNVAIEFYQKRARAGVVFSLPMEVTAIYHSGGAMRLLDWWIANDCAVPNDTMLQYLSHLDERIVTPSPNEESTGEHVG